MIGLAYDVKEYRRQLEKIVKPGDTVLEIGPHKGLSTKSYAKTAGKTILVDKGTDCLNELEKLQEENQNIHFICSDARGFDAIKLVLQEINQCDVFALDMGGGRYPDTVFKVWATWSGVFKPRDSIIRNRGLIELIKKAQLLDDTPVLNQDSGWLTDYGRSTPYKLKKQIEEFKYWIDIDEPLE